MNQLKKSIFIACLLSLPVMAISQLQIGLLGGISSADIPGERLAIFNEQDVEAFKLSVENAEYGYHFGVFVRAQILRFYIEPAFIFNSNQVNYTLEDIIDDTGISTIRKESYQHLDIPLMLGWKFGILRLGAGPVAHVFIDSSSELFDVSGYRQKFDDMTWGWQAIVGLDIWLARLDVRYEGNFSKHGDHFEFYGRDYNFAKSPSRLIASIGINF
jgi:hypothetical protein